MERWVGGWRNTGKGSGNGQEGMAARRGAPSTNRSPKERPRWMRARWVRRTGKKITVKRSALGGVNKSACCEKARSGFQASSSGACLPLLSCRQILSFLFWKWFIRCSLFIFSLFQRRGAFLRPPPPPRPFLSLGSGSLSETHTEWRRLPSAAPSRHCLGGENWLTRMGLGPSFLYEIKHARLFFYYRDFSLIATCISPFIYFLLFCLINTLFLCIQSRYWRDLFFHFCFVCNLNFTCF